MSLNSSMPSKLTDGFHIQYSEDLEIELFRMTRAQTVNAKDAISRQDKFDFTLASRYPDKLSATEVAQNGMVTPVKGEMTKSILVPVITDMASR
jgi:hypothetical protein